MKLVIDMNLSPDWVEFLNLAGHTVIHWSAVGLPGAMDREILSWAREREHVVFTHDLDFGAIIAATEADAPSVVQVRSQDPTPEHCGALIIATLEQHAGALAKGALISVDENRARVRILPMRG